MGTIIILEVTILINQLKSHLEADKFRVDNITQPVYVTTSLVTSNLADGSFKPIIDTELETNLLQSLISNNI